jgi:hypothetical protein
LVDVWGTKARCIVVAIVKIVPEWNTARLTLGETVRFISQKAEGKENVLQGGKSDGVNWRAMTSRLPPSPARGEFKRVCASTKTSRLWMAIALMKMPRTLRDSQQKNQMAKVVRERANLMIQGREA